MAKLPAPRDPRKATDNDAAQPAGPPTDSAAADLAAFLGRDLDRHPEYQKLLAAFLAMTPEEQLNRLAGAVQRPLGETLDNLLREEPQVLKRFAERSLPMEAGAELEQRH